MVSSIYNMFDLFHAVIESVYKESQMLCFVRYDMLCFTYIY